MLKIRSTPTDGKQNAQPRQCAVENKNVQFYIPATTYGNRNFMEENSPKDYTSNNVQPPLPTLNLPDSGIFSKNREESQPVEPLCTNEPTLEQSAQNAPNAPDTPTKVSKRKLWEPANKYNDFYM